MGSGGPKKGSVFEGKKCSSIEPISGFKALSLIEDSIHFHLIREEVVVKEVSIPRSMGSIAVDTDKCMGCRSCEAVCALYHEGKFSPELSRIRVVKDWGEPGSPIDTEFGLLTCRQCPKPKCLEACPEDAISADPKTGARAIDPEKCTGCQICIEACLFTPARVYFNAEMEKAIKCDLCGGDPQCVKICPTSALRFKLSKSHAKA